MKRLFTLFSFLLALTIAATSFADRGVSEYLSAIAALERGDFKNADRGFRDALVEEPDVPEILSKAVTPALIVDRFEDAAIYANRLAAADIPTEMGTAILVAMAAEAEDFARAHEILEKNGQALGPILKDLLAAWVHLGRGSVTDALATFKAMEAQATSDIMGQFHKALMLASVGDFETADTILTGGEQGNLRMTDGSILAHIQILSELGETDSALLLHDRMRGFMDASEWADMRARILAGTETYAYITTAKEGVAEVFSSLATIFAEYQDPTRTVALAKIGQRLRSDNRLSLFIAEEFANLEQYELALDEFGKIPPDSFEFIEAELSRADVLVDAGEPEAAVEVLRALERDNPTNSRFPRSIGDIHRVEGECDKALAAYARAEATIQNPRRSDWYIFHAQAICHFNNDDWPQAEENFRQALKLSPNQATVLNYLGYSLVERREKLSEAQDMIRRAAELRPDSGAIADSLGWVYYRLGKFEEAVEPMEKAVELLPTDPIINDHLGDVYWMVDRKREAQFQWQRALSFEPKDGEAQRIRAKLDRGLDAVLREEAASGAQTSSND